MCDWFRMAADLYPSIFEQPGEHADEVETSLGLAFFPELMQPELADDGRGAAVALRGDQPRLGEHHAALAPGHAEHRPGRPVGGDGGEGPAADGRAGRSGWRASSSSWRRRRWMRRFPIKSRARSKRMLTRLLRARLLSSEKSAKTGLPFSP